jgi:hypothetical protein
MEETMRDRRARRVAVFVALSLTTAGCHNPFGPGSKGKDFVLDSSPTPPPSPPASVSLSASSLAIGTPTSFVIDLGGIFVSPNTDCSGAIPVSGTGGGPLDLATSPTLWAGTAPSGTYECLGLAMSDIISFVSPVTAGPCTAGVLTQHDIYRIPENDFLDLDLNPIVSHGTNAAPVADAVVILFSTSPATAMARGFSPNQTYNLSKQIIVPTTATLYWDIMDTIIDEMGVCSVSAIAPIVSS